MIRKGTRGDTADFDRRFESKGDIKAAQTTSNGMVTVKPCIVGGGICTIPDIINCEVIPKGVEFFLTSEAIRRLTPMFVRGGLHTIKITGQNELTFSNKILV